MMAQHPWSQVLAWTLIHFLWQGALLGLLAAGTLMLMGGRRPALRYIAACLFLGLMALSPAVTFLVLLPKGGVGAGVAAAAAPGFREWLQPWLPTILLAWTAGLALLGLRLAGGLWMVHRLKTVDVFPCPAEWHQVLSRLSRQLGLTRTVRLLRSARVEVPMVAGWIRPVVLLPFAAFTQLDPAQLEAILVHELAHVRRHDFLVNLLQACIETLLFYHPAVWWLSRRIREERELCCDDAAVGLCRDPLGYARALALLEGSRVAAPQLVLSSHGGALMRRIQRLLHPQLLPGPRIRNFVLAGLALSAMGATAYALQDKKAEGPQVRKEGKASAKERPEAQERLKAQVEAARAKAEAARGKAEAARSKEEAARSEAESIRQEVEVIREEAEKAAQEARRFQVRVIEKDGKKHVTVLRDGKVVTDEVVDIPDVKFTREGRKHRIVVKRDGKVVQDEVFEIPEPQAFGRTWVWHGDEDMPEPPEPPTPPAPPAAPDAPPAPPATPRLRAFSTTSRRDVDRLKAEVQALRRQVEELQKKLGK